MSSEPCVPLCTAVTVASSCEAASKQDRRICVEAGLRYALVLLSFTELLKWCLFHSGCIKMLVQTKAAEMHLGVCAQCTSPASRRAELFQGQEPSVCLILSRSELSCPRVGGGYLHEKALCFLVGLAFHLLVKINKNLFYAYGCGMSQRQCGNDVQMGFLGIRGIKRSAGAISGPELTVADCCPLCVALTWKS